VGVENFRLIPHCSRIVRPRGWDGSKNPIEGTRKTDEGLKSLKPAEVLGKKRDSFLRGDKRGSPVVPFRRVDVLQLGLLMLTKKKGWGNQL